MPTTPDVHRSYDLGSYVDEHYAFLRYCLRLPRLPGGVALEFGVGTGTSMRQILAEGGAYGFDSFKGLPEDWRPGFSAGAFACEPPHDLLHRLVIGLFEDTLPEFFRAPMPSIPISLVHIDCDLYSSTRTVLKHVMPHVQPGCYIVFDEWHGYEGCEQHEQRAWREYADTHPDLRWEVIGHSFQQWGIRIV